MNEKIRNLLIVFLICVIVFLTLLLGFVLGMRYENKKCELDNELDTELNIELSEEKLKEVSNILFERLSNIDGCGQNIISLNIGDKIYYQDLTENYISSYVLNSLFNEDKVQKESSDMINLMYKVSKEDYKKEFEKAFGTNNNYELPSKISSKSIVFQLIGDEYIGSLIDVSCQIINPIYYLEDYSQYKDNIYLVVYLLQPAGNNMYSLNNNIYTMEELIQYHQSEIIKYKFTFKIENDNYIFESIERM